MTKTATKQQHSGVQEIYQGESIAEFLERVVEIKVRREGAGTRIWWEPVVMTPNVAADLAGYEYDMCGTEQPEPVSGAVFTFRACRNHPMTPQGGFDFVAACWREGDVAYFQISQED